jgi:hypothetical protein
MQKYALLPEFCYISSQNLVNCVKLRQGTQKTIVLNAQAFLFYNKAPKLVISLAKLSNKKKTPWSESASELYRPIGRLSAK